MMRSTLRLLIIALAAMATLSSCEDVISLDPNFNQRQLVVDGWVYDDTTVQTVRLSYTQPYFDSSALKPARGAEVGMIDNTGRFDTLHEEEPGVYRVRGWRGEMGKTYYLGIRHEGEEYIAADQIRRVAPIDSLNYEFREERLGQDAGYYLLFYASDFPGRGDAYRFTVQRNRWLYNEVDETVVADDLNTDGLPFIPPIRNRLTPEPFAAGDTITVRINSLSLFALRFFREASRQANNNGLFSRPIANIFTNVQNRREGGPAAIGYFGASAVSKATVVIQP